AAGVDVPGDGPWRDREYLLTNELSPIPLVASDPLLAVGGHVDFRGPVSVEIGDEGRVLEPSRVGIDECGLEWVELDPEQTRGHRRSDELDVAVVVDVGRHQEAQLLVVQVESSRLGPTSICGLHLEDADGLHDAGP